jgi:SLT domain-containing protein
MSVKLHNLDPRHTPGTADELQFSNAVMRVVGENDHPLSNASDQSGAGNKGKNMSSATEAWKKSIAEIQTNRKCSFDEAYHLGRVVHHVLFNEYLAECEDRKQVMIANEDRQRQERRERLTNSSSFSSGEQTGSETTKYLEGWMLKAVGLNDGDSASLFEQRLRTRRNEITTKRAAEIMSAIRAKIETAEKLDYTAAWLKAQNYFPALAASMNRAQSIYK